MNMRMNVYIQNNCSKYENYQYSLKMLNCNNVINKK